MHDNSLEIYFQEYILQLCFTWTRCNGTDKCVNQVKFKISIHQKTKQNKKHILELCKRLILNKW